MTLTKSTYMMGKQCPKRLWLNVYQDYELAIPSEHREMILENGDQVGALARDLFEGGSLIVYEDTTHQERVKQTQAWLADDTIETIYEATFEARGVSVMVDILRKLDDGSYALYEVKSSTWREGEEIPQKYIDDLSVQRYVVKQAGYKVSQCFMVLLNADYVYQRALDINKLFVTVDITRQLNTLKSVSEDIKQLQSVLDERDQSDLPVEPTVEIGRHCKQPYVCDAYEYCWSRQRQIPEYSVFNVFQLKRGVCQV